MANRLRSISPLLLLILCGCGGETFHNITGTVTLDGAPLDAASITFVPVDKGNPAVGRTDATGRYTLETGNTAGIRPGSYKVVVVKNAYTPFDERSGQGGALLPSPVPDKYAKAETSDITLTVPTSGDGAYDVKLVKK